MLEPEQPLGLRLVDPRERMIGADLRAVAAERRELPRNPGADVDDERRGPGGLAEHVRLDAQNFPSPTASPLGPASTTARITPLGMVT